MNDSIKSNKPFVCVWMCTYNHEDYIDQAINSVLMQETNFPIKLIISEDCSTDKTREICKIFQKNNNEIIDLICANENTKGKIVLEKLYPACFNSGAKYIALCEGDDYWTDPLKLQKQVDLLEQHPESIACHHWQRCSSKNKEGIFEEYPSPTHNGEEHYAQEIASIRDIFANKIRVKARTVMFKNFFNEIGGLPDWFENVPYGDVPLSMIAGKYGDFLFIDEEMAVYRRSETGLTGREKKKQNFTVFHNLNWIFIWELGIKYHDYNYIDEAIHTILEFYQKILNYSPNSLMLKLKLLWNALINSNLNIGYRMRVFNRLLSLCCQK